MFYFSLAYAQSFIVSAQLEDRDSLPSAVATMQI